MGLRQSVPIEKSDNNEINEVEQINESDGNINAKSLPINEINSNEIKSNYSQEESENNYENKNNICEKNVENDTILLTDNKNNFLKNRTQNIDYTLKESIDMFVAKIIKDASLEVAKKQEKINKINPKYKEWLLYLRKWTVLDTKNNKDLILKTIDNDIENNITNNAETFTLIYNKYYKDYCSLGKVAFDITKTNFRINDSNIIINNKKNN